MADALLHLLPFDVVELIGFHMCAMRIQRIATGFVFGAHRRARAWPRVLAHFRPHVLRTMLEHSSIRRELRVEPDSWIARRDEDRILEECAQGQWGPSQRQLLVRRGYRPDERFLVLGGGGVDGADSSSSSLSPSLSSSE